MVVFPTPGGPQRIMEGTVPDLMALYKNESGEDKCSWPIRSSKWTGRILSAKGVWFISVGQTNDIVPSVYTAFYLNPDLFPLEFKTSSMSASSIFSALVEI